VLADPDMGPVASQPPLSDLRVVAAGFYDLSEKAPAPAPPQPLPAVPLQAAPPAPVQAAPPRRVQAAPPASAQPAPPAPAQATVLRIYSVAAANVTPPVVVQQAFPPYPGQLVPSGQGVLEVVIDEAGAVESAVMTKPVSAAYDRLALSAARTWQYRPATLNGV